MIYTFTTRAGLNYKIEFIREDDHNITGRVINGRKSFVGKVLAFAKNNMLDLKITENAARH
ncbi:MAG: hypothetical protein ACOVN5_07210 [Aquidulcibacter sp.]